MTRVAGIDCGTNSIRLLVADVDPATGALADVERTMEVVRLGQGVDRTGRLAPEALERALAATRRYAARCAELGVEAIRFVATSTTRDAENRREFVDGVRTAIGVEPEVIEGAEEARLSFRGATGVLGSRHPGPLLVVDLGGGSTELVLGTDAPIAAYSMDVGCVHRVRGDRGVGAENQLGRAAAEVHDEERAGVPRAEHTGGAAEREPGLFRALDHLGLDADRGPHAVDELAAVLGVPGGRGGDKADRLDAELGAPRRVAPGRRERTLERLGREPAGAVHSLTEPDDLHGALDVGERPGSGVHVRDEETDRVGAAVDPGHASHGGNSAMSPVAPRSAGVSRSALYHGAVTLARMLRPPDCSSETMTTTLVKSLPPAARNRRPPTVHRLPTSTSRPVLIWT